MRIQILKHTSHHSPLLLTRLFPTFGRLPVAFLTILVTPSSRRGPEGGFSTYNPVIRAMQSIVQACVDYIKEHPQWRLSLQIHKIIDIK